MRRVIIESPYAGNVAEHMRYLQRCIRDSLARGESPYASHQMLTQALDDATPEERKAGIEAGFAWRMHAETTVVYWDYGISEGMRAGIRHAERERAYSTHTVEYRKIGRNKEPSR